MFYTDSHWTETKTMITRRKLLSAGAAGAAVALAGCGDDDALASESNKSNNTSMGAQVTRIVDDEAGVVCYIRDHEGGTGESISCIPIEDTRLGGGLQ